MPLKTTRGDAGGPVKGRGAPSNLEGRYESWTRETADDGWAGEEEARASLKTEVTRETAKSIIARNDSPDIPFDQSINPYRGCEHGCVYCYARPSHAYLGLSPGLDFETRIFAKHNAAELLRKELAAPGYRCSAIALGANTDPYQPVERGLRITRSITEVLVECEHPFTIVTKNALLERAIHPIAPRAAAPYRRIEAIRRLAESGIPTGVLVAPVIPFVTDRHMEEILERAREAG